MIRCLAIDDEPLALRQLETYISKVDFLELVAACPSALYAKEILASEVVDAIFCDINMPDLDGMSFARSLANPPILVFTTAYSEHAVEGFKVGALDYLLKPFGLDDFQRAAQKVKKQYELEHRAEISSLDTDDSIYFKTDYKIVRVEVGKITHVEGMSEYLKIFTQGRKEPVIVLLSMKKLEERLPSDRFMRIHKSFIINLGKIAQVSKGHVTMEDGTLVPVGDLYREKLQAYINSKFLSK